jgi:hypothetical protein
VEVGDAEVVEVDFENGSKPRPAAYAVAPLDSRKNPNKSVFIK